MLLSARRVRRTLIFLSLVLVLASLPQPGRSFAQTDADAQDLMLLGSAPTVPDASLQAIVDGVVGQLPGKWGVAVKKLDTGQYASFNADVQQVSASLYKLWVLGELYRQVAEGTVSLDNRATVTSEDAAYDVLTGELRLPPGSEVQIARAAYLMVTLSDNTAASLLVRVLGAANVSRFMSRAGLSNSVFDWEGDEGPFTTPNDMLRLLELLATSHLVDATSSREMVDLMLGQQINNLLPEGLPDTARMAHKTGALEDLLHDAGIVYTSSGPYIIVAMSSELPDYGVAWEAMPSLSKQVHAYFTAREAAPARYFQGTRQVVGHDFLKFWHEFGGAETFGLPIGAERMSDGRLVQQFERARFEWHPGRTGAGGERPGVSLGLLGEERARQLRLTWPRAQDSGEGRYFEETGQTLAGDFYDFWLNNGGERVFGLPISPAAEMQSPADDKMYLTQWFQRARMELHKDGSGIVLAALGREVAPSP
ncbi:MAG: class A beta-lactamase-related serine hydrolase [Chloroflexota bacterium]|nr:class A beta-lactamase-related serine hydrolase [Chloroflexota bacterium]